MALNALLKKFSGKLDPEKIAPSRTAEKLYLRARVALEAGRRDEAACLARQAVQIAPLVNRYHVAIAEALMPGDRYLQVIANIQKTLRPESYLEIGVCTGNSMALVDRGARAVGIDPEFRIKKQINARARFYPITSDQFFDRYDLYEELSMDRLDLAFIDGLHIFEQVFRDFLNTETYAGKNTVVLVHDCLPVSAVTSGRERKTPYWPGDVWKLIPCLKQLRPNLNINVIPCLPSGLGVITGFGDSAPVPVENLDEIIGAYREMKFEAIPEDFRTYFSVVSNDWSEVKLLMPRIHS